MESFHCSSSSLDALNSFQGRRSSSVVVIAENESIPSPTFKSFRNLELSAKSSKRGSNIFQKINKFKLIEHSLNASNMSLDSHKQAVLPLIPIAPSVKNMNNHSLNTKNSKLHKLMNFFSKIIRFKRSETKKLASSISHSVTRSYSNEVNLNINTSYSYEKIISGQIKFDDLDLDRVEVIS